MSLWGCWVFLSCRTKVTELSLHQKGFQEEEEEGTGHVGRDLQRAPADGCPAEPRLTAVCELSWAACACLSAHASWAWDLWQQQCLSPLAALLPLRAAGGGSAEWHVLFMAPQRQCICCPVFFSHHPVAASLRKPDTNDSGWLGYSVAMEMRCIVQSTKMETVFNLIT